MLSAEQSKEAEFGYTLAETKRGFKIHAAVYATSAGGNSTTVPAGIGAALFALFATMSIAKRGFSTA